jgi:hypothetical protein
MLGIVIGLSLFIGGRSVRAERADWDAFQGRPIAAIRVEAGPVFDPSRPGEDNPVLQWANRLHVVTRPDVIRGEYGQRVGDPFDARLAAECRRNLLQLGIFADADVLVDAIADSVAVRLVTIDRWSLRTYPILRSQGGITEVGLVLGERNLLGHGIEVGAAGVYSTDVSSAWGRFRDPRLRRTRWDLGIDGRFDELSTWAAFHLAHPFYGEDAGWSASVPLEIGAGDERRFEAGEEVAIYRVEERVCEPTLGFHSDGRGLQRWSWFGSWRDLRGTTVARTGAMGIAWSYLRRGASYARDIDLMGPVEERGAGVLLQVGAGADLRLLGADRNRFLYRVDAAAGRGFGERASLGFQLLHHAFLDGGPPQDGRLFAELYGSWRWVENPGLLCAFRFGGDAFLDAAPHLRHSLGSDDRLRGYEARTLNGTRELHAGIETRLFTPYRLFFMRLGLAAFADAAAAWDDGEKPGWREARLGGGVGLRLGADPAGRRLMRLDVGFGTNSVAVSIASGSFFPATRALDFPSTRLWR